jgi:epoxide hydrolase-like predicted phosphatase
VIKAVIFDFFGVICSDDYWKSVKSNFSYPEKFGELSAAASTGNLSWRQFLQKISEETGKSTEELAQLFKEEQINPELLAYIDKLHAKYKTALLSNASSEYIHSLTQKLLFNDSFTEVMISSEIGLAKPDSKIFEHALSKLNTKPHETIFIDDTLKHIKAAEGLGIKAIRYENFIQMKKELEEILASSDN